MKNGLVNGVKTKSDTNSVKKGGQNSNSGNKISKEAPPKPPTYKRDVKENKHENFTNAKNGNSSQDMYRNENPSKKNHLTIKRNLHQNDLDQNNCEELKHSNISKNSTYVPDESLSVSNKEAVKRTKEGGVQPLQQIQFQQHYLKQSNTNVTTKTPVMQARFLTSQNSNHSTNHTNSSPHPAHGKQGSGTKLNSKNTDKNAQNKPINNRLMNMLAQNQEIEDPTPKNNINAKFTNNFLNVSLNNDKSSNQSKKNNDPNTKDLNKDNGVYSQALGILSKNGPSKNH